MGYEVGGFTRLEKAVLRQLIADIPAAAAAHGVNYPADMVAILQQQLDAAWVTERVNTGVGFFTTFDVPPGTPTTEDMEIDLHRDVEIDGYGKEMAFWIFIRNGVLTTLEAWPGETEDMRPYELTFSIGDTFKP